MVKVDADGVVPVQEQIEKIPREQNHPYELEEVPVVTGLGRRDKQTLDVGVQKAEHRREYAVVVRFYEYFYGADKQFHVHNPGAH